MNALLIAASVLLSRWNPSPHGSVWIPPCDSNVVYSPYNWLKSESGFVQTPNPGAYLKVGFTGSELAVDVDVSPLTHANVPAANYPLIRYSVDGGPATTVQLTAATSTLQCASHLSGGKHNLRVQYVAGYVFLDFWTPINVLRITGFELQSGARLVKPFGAMAKNPRWALFFGDSITNGDDDRATFAKGITNQVETQDATVGYPSVVAAGLNAEFGVVAYGGASWDGTAADGHTPGLMTFFSRLDASHTRLLAGKLTPTPDDLFINMGENVGPGGDDVVRLLTALRTASSPGTNIFILVPFSGRARLPLRSGVTAYQTAFPKDTRVYLVDLGNCPFLTDAGATMLSVDGQHPLVRLHSELGARLLQARSTMLLHK